MANSVADVASAASALRAMDTSEWVVVMSNAAFLLCVTVCYARSEYYRCLIYLYVAGASAFYHLCNHTEVCDEDALSRRLDLSASSWAVTATILLAGTLSREVEFVIHTVNGAALHVFYFFLVDIWSTTDFWLVIVFYPMLSTGIVVVSIVMYGFPATSIPWMVLGVCCVGTGLVVFNRDIANDELVSHGIWHILAAFGTCCFVISLRDVRRWEHVKYEVLG